MNFSEEVKATLWKIIDEMGINVSDYTVNPEKDFSRKKKWDFATLVKFIISMEGQSLKNELHKYFGYTTDCPSNASFNQRRAQVSSSAFEYLFNTFTEHYQNASDKRFRGYRLIACDGSDVNIAHNPADLRIAIALQIRPNIFLDISSLSARSLMDRCFVPRYKSFATQYRVYPFSPIPLSFGFSKLIVFLSV